MGRFFPVLAVALLTTGLRAQSFNVDFGSPGSVHGVPDSAYPAAGRPGFWNAVGPRGATSLVDTAGVLRKTTISFSSPLNAVACDHAGTSTGDDALLDDRLEFPPSHGGMTIDIANLRPGVYRLRLYSIDPAQGGCWPDALLVIVENSWQAMGLWWSGAYLPGESHTEHLVVRPTGGDVRIHVEGFSYGNVWLSGLQIENVLRPRPY